MRIQILLNAAASQVLGFLSRNENYNTIDAENIFKIEVQVLTEEYVCLRFILEFIGSVLSPTLTASKLYGRRCGVKGVLPYKVYHKLFML